MEPTHAARPSRRKFVAGVLRNGIERVESLFVLVISVSDTHDVAGPRVKSSRR